MPNILSNLRIREVSSVNRGAGEGVQILLMKNDKDKPMSKIGSVFSKLFGGEQNNETNIDKAVEGLAESVGTIVTEAKTPEEMSKSFTTTFEQFKEYLKTLAVGSTAVTKEGSEMDLKILAKSLGLPETATEADVAAAIAKQQTEMTAVAASVAKMQLELAVSKADFSAEELSFYEKAAGEDDGLGAETGYLNSAKKSFRIASKSDRAATLKAATPAVSADVQKVMDENAEMKKRLAALEASTSVAALAKVATESGLPETEAETIQKAYAGDKAAIDKLLGFVKTANAAAVEGGVFKELGSRTGDPVGDSAISKLDALAEGLRKADPKLSKSQAFAKVYADPANAELVAKERSENRPAA
jgi:hypothetical protein